MKHPNPYGKLGAFDTTPFVSAPQHLIEPLVVSPQLCIKPVTTCRKVPLGAVPLNIISDIQPNNKARILSI